MSSQLRKELSEGGSKVVNFKMPRHLLEAVDPEAMRNFFSSDCFYRFLIFEMCKPLTLGNLLADNAIDISSWLPSI